MKENIDLTENRDFIRKSIELSNPQGFYSVNTENTSIKDIIDKVLFTSEDSYEDLKDTGVILQGNASEREEKRLCGEFCAKNYCDCCGRPLMPYYDDCLCPKCNEHYEYNNLYPWN